MIVRDWDLSSVDANLVLWGQGADPGIIRSRHPQVARLAEKAVMAEGPHLRPVLVYREVKLEEPVLGQGLAECGNIWQHLPACLLDAESLVVAVCTIGRALEERVIDLMDMDPVYGLAVDAFGTVAVDALERAALKVFRTMAETRELGATGPLSPGINGWPLDKGQEVIFSLLDSQELRTVPIALSAACQMSPRKSTSFVLGLGTKEDRDVISGGGPCDDCTMRLTCLYKGRHQHAIF